MKVKPVRLNKTEFFSKQQSNQYCYIDCYGDIFYHTPKMDSSTLNIIAELSLLGEDNSFLMRHLTSRERLGLPLYEFLFLEYNNVHLSPIVWVVLPPVLSEYHNIDAPRWRELSVWRIYIYIYIYISCCAGSTDIPDPLSPLLPIFHHPRQVFRTTSRILT